MTPRVSPRLLATLALIGGAAAFAPDTAYAYEPCVPRQQADADAASRDDRADRRVLRASDVSTTATVSAELRIKAHEARLASIEQLKQIIRDTDPPGDQKAVMLLRLADLYFEEGRDIYLDEMCRYNNAVDQKFSEGGDINSVNQGDYTKESTAWAQKSIKLYQQILASYPQFERADEATYFLGQALSDTNQKDAANQEFTRLVKVYPDSKFVPDAYIQIGEYWFENKAEALKALSAYQKAAAYKEHDKWSFAMYKLAWCYYNVGEYGKAIDTMKAVVDYTGGDTSNKNNIQLRDEALKDLVRFFADAGDMDEAVAYFTKLGEKGKIRDLLKTLASTYIDQGKFEQAVTMYRRLIAENPTDKAAPDYQDQIIQAYTKMGRKQETVDEINRMLKDYGKNSAWARSNASDQTAVKDAAEKIESNLWKVATSYHNDANKIRTGPEAAKLYGLAEQAYRTYLGEFPAAKYTYEAHYSLGELLYKVKKFDAAYEEYMATVKLDPKGQHSRFCAESAIFAADEMVKKEKAAGTTGGPDPGKKTDEMPLSEWEQKSLAALDQFRTVFPQDPKVKNVIYKAGYLLYNKNHFREASERFNQVIAMDPASREAEQAANLILDSFNLVEDWESLKKNSKFYYDQQGLGSADFKKEVYGIYENASLKLIEVDFKKGADKAKAAVAYWDFYKEFPTSANADLALNNASVYYHDLGRTSDAIKVRQELIAKFPKSKFYKDQIASLGFDYEAMADFGNAANWYEKLYATDPAHPGAADAIYSAGLFRVALGQWEAGIKNYQQYMSKYPDKPGLNALNLETAKIYEDHEKWPEASKVYLAFFTKPPTTATIDEVMFARLRYGLLMDKLGQGAQVTKHWNDSLAWFNKARSAPGVQFEVAGEYAAQMMYILAEPQFQAFLAQKIKGPASKLPQKAENKYLTDQLVGKAKAMQSVEATYTAILNTGAGEWGLAALTRLGQVYENMSESLKTSAAPSYLTEDQLEIYRMQLEDKAFPQVEKAVTAYSEALKKAYELNLYNDNTAFATRRLGELRPDEYPGLFEKVPESKFSAPSTTTATFEKEP